MEKKVEKELKDAQDDIREAIDEENKRSASISSLESKSKQMEQSLGELQEEAHNVKNRLWKKSAKWIIIVVVLFIVIGGIAFLTIYRYIKDLFN